MLGGPFFYTVMIQKYEIGQVRADGMFNVGDQELVRRLARYIEYV